jgi:hypothetical protein
VIWLAGNGTSVLLWDRKTKEPKLSDASDHVLGHIQILAVNLLGMRTYSPVCKVSNRLAKESVLGCETNVGRIAARKEQLGHALKR